MKDTQFIPEKYKLNISRFGNSEIPFGVPKPFSTTPELQKEIVRNVGYSTNAVTYDNTPLSGYHIMVDGKQKVQIFHPDGYAIDITMYNIGIILRDCKIIQGIIHDELIFVFDKSFNEYILVPYNSDTYNEIKTQSDKFFSAKSGSTELKYGCTVNFDGNKFVYLGRYWFSSIGKNGIKVVERYIVLNPRNCQYYFMTTKTPDAITDEYTDYPSEDKLFDSINSVLEIKSFYKSGSYNAVGAALQSYCITKEKPNKKDFKFTYVSYKGKGYTNTKDSYPIFLSDDGNIYASVDVRFNRLSYGISSYDVGSTVTSVPFDVSTLTADLTKDAKGDLLNVTKQRIKNIAFPRLVK